MRKRPIVHFSDRLSSLGVAHEGKEKELNIALGKVTKKFGSMEFEGLRVVPELYHVKEIRGGAKVEWHRHPFIELTWIEGGSMVYESSLGEILINDGELFVMPAFEPHRWRLRGGIARLHGFMLSVTQMEDQLNSSLGWFLEGAKSLNYNLGIHPEVSRSLSKTEEEAVLGDLGKESAEGHLRVGLSSIWRKIIATCPLKFEKTSEEISGGYSQILEQAISYILLNLSRKVSVGDVAAEVKLSPRHLDRLFHEAFDMPAGSFLLHSRLERARHLLEDDSMSIKQVALESGFSDANYFGRIFKDRLGKTPGAFRREGG